MKLISKILCLQAVLLTACTNDNGNSASTSQSPVVTASELNTTSQLKNAAGSMVGALDSARKLPADTQKKIIKMVSLSPHVLAVEQILQKNKQSLTYSVVEDKSKPNQFVVEARQGEAGQVHFIAIVDAKTMQLLNLHELTDLL
jgi:PBP1b-binding outer membrane lipoprotein LpoB